MQTWFRLAVLVVLLALGGVILLVVPMPDIQELQRWAAGSGVWLPAVFVAGYAAATLLLLPKNVLSMAAGLVFGLGSGVVLVWFAAMLGASGAFWLGRRLGREGVTRIAGRHLDRLDNLVRRHGVLAVLVARLVPVVPFTAVNYGSGLTAVAFPAYLAATAVGILPGTVAYVAVGAYGTRPNGWQLWVAAGALLALSVGGSWFARRRTRGPVLPAPEMLKTDLPVPGPPALDPKEG
ncbi:MAG TPA: TVP38/TMEM64 family protein [Cellulomonadaceae bacterium]|nr:TVP38/TMEM64 family protein [Cellulomonadaceae bacterium]